MPPWTRQQAAATAQEIAYHLKLVDNVKALQTGQRELADAIGAITLRINKLETELAIAKSDIRLEAMREAQIIINAVQGGLNQRIENVAVKLATLEGKCLAAIQLDNENVSASVIQDRLTAKK